MDENQVVDLQRKEVNGEYIYFDSQGNYFDNNGTSINKVKFESCVGHQLTNKQQQTKEQTKEQTQERTTERTK